MDYENNEMNIKRFEDMLHTKSILFFEVDEFEEIILHYFDEGKMTLCKKALQMALDQHPKSVEIKLLEVEVLVFEEKYKKAIKILSQIDDVSPKHDEVYLFTSEIYSKQGKHRKAIEVLLILLDFYDEPHELYNLIANEYLFLKNTSKALHYFKKYLKTEKEDSTALFNIVNCFNELNKHKEAIQFLKEVIADTPYFIFGWIELGNQYLNIKLHHNAIESFNMAIAINDSYSSAYFKKAYALQEIDEYEQAIDCFKETYNLIDDQAMVDHCIAKCYELLKDYDKAEELLKLSIEKDPACDETWIDLANLYITKKELSKAMKCITDAIALDDENPLFWKVKSVIHFQCDELRDSEQSIAKSVSLDDLDLDSYLKWADLVYVLKDLHKSADILFDALSKFNSDPEILYRLAGLKILTRDNKGFEFLACAMKEAPNLVTTFKDLFPMLLKNTLVKEILHLES